MAPQFTDSSSAPSVASRTPERTPERTPTRTSLKVLPRDPAPFDFGEYHVKAAGDDRLIRAVNNAVVRNDIARSVRMKELPDSDALRTLAGDIKQHTLDYLDYYLVQLKAAYEARGGHVYFARNAADATRIILEIAREANVKTIIKSKSMVSEEIELAHSFEENGYDVVETDLGEFIVQIDHDKPSHIVTPIIHKDRQSIGELFSKYFSTPYTDDPIALTRQARVYLRDKFRRADMGMTGGNFIVAETGDICSVENEGNVRQSTTSPRVLLSLVGIEKLVPRVDDLAVMLKLLARSATGQPMTVYTSLFGAPRTADERDGPEECHLVLMDNGRSEILASEEYRETLRCIRCGACLNACPIYRSIGGHAYGSVYPGPIGALITPLMQGLSQFKDLPSASSLCGACFEACPVKINIPKHLINLRRDMVNGNITGRFEKMIYRVWAQLLKRPVIYSLMTWTQARSLRLLGKVAGRRGFIRAMPPPASGWTKVRDMPVPAATRFGAMWNKSRK